MAVTAYWYAKAFITAFNQPNSLDWDTNTIKCMLTTSTYTPSQYSHQYKSSVTNEVAGTGYSAGGATLTTKTLTSSNNVVTFDADDVSWSTSTITARRAVLYDSTGGGADASRPLLWFIDFGADVGSTSATFSIVFNASGIATITATDYGS